VDTLARFLTFIANILATIAPPTRCYGGRDYRLAQSAMRAVTSQAASSATTGQPNPLGVTFSSVVDLAHVT
jgi:hypothetical protein